MKDGIGQEIKPVSSIVIGTKHKWLKSVFSPMMILPQFMTDSLVIRSGSFLLSGNIPIK